MNNRHNMAVQRIATAGPNGRSFVRFDHKSGGWVMSVKTDEGWGTSPFTAKVVIIPHSVQVGFTAFEISADGEKITQRREYASGDNPAIEFNNLPEIRWRDFDGEIHINRDGWIPSAVVDGYTMRKNDKGELERIDIRIEATKKSSYFAVSNLFQSIVEYEGDGFPMVQLTSQQVQSSNSVSFTAPVLEIVKWVDAENTAKPSPAPAPTKPSVDETQEEEFERLMNG